MSWPSRRRGVFLRLDTLPVVRVWLGVGDRRLPADGVETDGRALYHGGGEAIGTDTVRQLLNGRAERFEVTLSGAAVTAEVARLADQDRALIRYRDFHLGVRRFDEQEQGVGPTMWLFHGKSDSISLTATPTEAGQQRAITLSIGSPFTFRERAAPVYFTDIDQRRRSSDDTFFNHVAGYSQGSTQLWTPT